MQLRKLFSWLLVAVLMLVAVAGCEGVELSAIELVPRDANLIAEIQINRIIDDQDLRDAYAEFEKEPGQPQTVEEALDKLVEETGVDLRDFSQAIIFADITTLEQAGYVGVIIEGTFNEERFIDNIERQVGEEFITSDYKGYKLYTDETEEFVIAFLSNEVLLLGTTNAVKDTIQVSTGDRRKVSGIILDTYNQLGDALIKCAFELPEEAREALTEETIPGGIPISFEPFADIDIVGFALNKVTELMTTRIDLHFLSPDSAQDAKDTLSGTLILLRGVLQDPEIKELLGKVEVTGADSWVTISFEITISEIERLTETFQ